MIKLVSGDKVQRYDLMTVHQYVVCCIYILSLPLSPNLPQIHRYYHSSGHTINSAMEEGVSGAAKNKYVRGAVKSSVKAGVSAAYDSK